MRKPPKAGNRRSWLEKQKLEKKDCPASFSTAPWQAENYFFDLPVLFLNRP
jgi:hypothetical protein